MEDVAGDSRSPLLDDDALFAVVDDVWEQQSPLRGLESLSEDSHAVAQDKKPKKKRRRDRNRPQHEIARLQEESERLELKLHGKVAKASKRARSSLQSAATNAELKKMLRQSLDDMHAMEQNLSRQMEKLLQTIPRSLVATTRDLPFDAAQDDSTFRTMARSIDGQYSDMDRVLRLAGLQDIDSEVTDAYICRSNGTDGEVLKSRARLLSPFKSRALVDALWGYIESCESTTMAASGSRDLELPRGVSTRVAVQKYEIALGDYVCTMRMVVKQFVEKNRTVHVWNVLADWQGVGAVRNVKSCEHGWGFIQPTKGNTSVCLSYSLMTPTIEGLLLSGNCDAIRSLIKLYHRFVISRLQTLENQTLDQLIQDEKSATAAVHAH